jgi:hypothetical protein
MDLAFRPEDDGFWFGPHFIRIVRNFTTEAGTTEDIGFVATDLAKALEIRRTADLADRLDPDQKGGGQISTLGGTQTLTVISESGFYDVVVRSDKPQGKQLRHLVTREILPQLRKTGTYSVAPAAPPEASLSGGKDDIAAVYLRCAAVLPNIGVKPGIAYAHAYNAIEKATGLRMEELRLALPAAEGEVPTLNATAVGKLLGNTAPKIVNRMLRDAGLQVLTNQGWQLTKAGMEYGEAKPFANNGHTGYQLLWLPRVVERLRQS